MGRTLKELEQAYNEQKDKIKEGERRLKDLFAVGTTVKHPLKGGQEVTFHSFEEENQFFRELAATREYPLDEISRNNCTEDHMKLFLFSKGFSPEDVAELLTDPDSERSRMMAEQIRGIRQEYYDQVINKDLDKISKMYADAFRNLGSMNMDWMRKAATPEGYIEMMPMLNALTGVQSYWEQTNNLGGNKFRAIDRQLMTAVVDRLNAEGIHYNKILDTLKSIQVLDQNIRWKFDNMPQDGDEAIGYNMKLSDLAVLIRSFAAVPAGVTIEEFGEATDKYSREGQFREQHTYYAEGDGPLGSEYESTEYIRNIKAWLQGEEGAVQPVQIFENNSIAMSSRKHWGVRSAGPAEAARGFDVRRPEWKTAMEEGFRRGELMDPGSVIHCIQLAKKGEYDAVSGKAGDGEKMLQVMNGDLTGYDGLSDLSKAAAAGHLVMEHPELFFGSAQQMQRSAQKLKMDLDHPVYVSALEGAIKLSDPRMVRKAAELKEALAMKKLEAGLQGASAEEKKNLVKTLFLMQLGNAERAAGADRDASQPDMLGALAAGEKVRFLLPGARFEDAASREYDLPAGGSPLESGGSKEGFFLRNDILKDGSKVAEGMRQSVLYENDRVLSVQLSGATGHAAAADGQLDIDLRGIDGKQLHAVLTGLDEKMASMTPEELDGMIGKLRGVSLERPEMAALVNSFGLDALGNEKPNKAQMELAAKEIDPDTVLGLNDLTVIDGVYRKPLDGERKYDAPEPVSTESFEKALQADTVPDQKAFFARYLAYFKDQERLMRMYADGAERMRRIREANENSKEPLANVRIFAQKKEKELAEKYRAAKNEVENMKRGISRYKYTDGASQANIALDATKAWIGEYTANPEISAKVAKGPAEKGPSMGDFEASLAAGFSAVDFENLSFREQQNLTVNKWKLLGVSYSNSDKYQNILDSMDALKKMRGMPATQENILAYQKECGYLRDLCEDYIVSRRNPWTPDGKERKRMVTDVWEGISNVTGQTFEKAIASADPSKTISDLGIHAGYRRSISLEELKAREPERRERLKAEKKARKEEALRQQAARKEAAHAKDTGTTERKF